MKRRSEGWPLEHRGHNTKRFLVRQVRKVIDEPAQLALGIGKDNAFDEPLKQKLGTQPKRLFELDTRPNIDIYDAEFAASGFHPIALFTRNGATTDKFEGVRHAAWGAASLFHITCGLRFGKTGAIDALDDRAAGLPILEGFDAHNIPTQITAGLAVPRKIAPTRAQMIGKDQTLKILPTEIFEMDRPYGAGDDACHDVFLISAALP